MDIRIRRARPDDASPLSDIAIRSKRSNGYDDAFMAACVGELTVTPEKLAESEYWVAEAETLCGCACLGTEADGRAGEVSFFFIDPAWQRRGVGRLLWDKLLERARTQGFQTLRLDADPAAVPFYEAMGFRVVGQAPSGSIRGRTLPHMLLDILDN